MDNILLTLDHQVHDDSIESVNQGRSQRVASGAIRGYLGVIELIKIVTLDSFGLSLGGSCENEPCSTFVVFWFLNDKESWRTIRYKIG